MLGMQCQHLHSAFRASAGPSAPENARSPRIIIWNFKFDLRRFKLLFFKFVELVGLYKHNVPAPVHAAEPFKSHHACVCWTCCVSLSVMTRRFFLSFNLRSRRVHLVQPNLQQAPRARFHCGVTGRCVVSLPPRELPVVLRKARTISQNKKFFSQPTHSRLRSATQNKPLLLKPPL